VPDSSNTQQPADAVSFQKFIEEDVQRKMIDKQKKYDAAWQRVAGSINEAGSAKAALLLARTTGDNVAGAAVHFRNMEAAVLESVHAMVDLTAEDYS